VHWVGPENALQVRLETLIIQLLFKFLYAKIVRDLLEQYFHENPAAWGCRLFCQVYALQRSIADRLRIEQVCEETRKVPQLGLLKSMNCVKLCFEQLLKGFYVCSWELAESLADMTVVAQIGAVLHAAFKDHIAKFYLLPRSDLEFEEFVAAFLEVNRRHNHQVDSLT